MTYMTTNTAGAYNQRQQNIQLCKSSHHRVTCLQLQHPAKPSLHPANPCPCQHPGAQSMVNIREAMSSMIQSMPSSRLSPVTALQACMSQWCVVISSRFKPFLISCADRAPGKSCLFANTSNVAPASLSSNNRLWSSCLQSASLILSALSTTHISPSVLSK